MGVDVVVDELEIRKTVVKDGKTVKKKKSGGAIAEETRWVLFKCFTAKQLTCFLFWQVPPTVQL
jgi:hypothetical protein